MSLVCWLPLDGTGRNLGIKQFSINEYIDTENNGKTGKCAEFSSSSHYVELGTTLANYFNGDPFSICFWIKSLEDGTRGVIFGGYGLPSTTDAFNLEINDGTGTTNYIRFWWAGTIYTSNPDYVTYNEWVHLAIVYTGTQILMYKNGVLTKTHTATLPAIPTGNSYQIGRDSRTSATIFTGYMNDFRFYDHALSTEEVKEISQGLICHCKLDNLNFVDSSGYGNRGTWNGSTAAVLYDSSIRNSQSVQITDGLNGYITIPIYLNKDAVTMSVWIKSTSGATGTGSYHMPFEINESNYEMSITSDGKLRNGFVISGTRYADNSSNASVISDKKWHMITATYDGTTIKRYVDGTLYSTREISGTLSGGLQTIYVGRYGTRTQYGNVDICESDLRLYCTALSADDIKSLYQTSEKIDKNGNLYAYEFKENESINPTFRKNGVVGSYLLTEKLFNILDPNYYVEPDGSTWIRIAHHNNPATKLFASNNTFTTKVYTDEDRWFYGSLCNYISDSWELMVKQKFTSDGTENKFRWVQSVNPMDGSDEAYNQVKEASITKITTSGYSTVDGYGGIWRINSNTYLCAHNGGTKAQWFGAIGSWNAWKGGIPGYATGNTAITTGYIDLYLRVDNHINDKTSIGKHGNNFIQTKELKEI